MPYYTNEDDDVMLREIQLRLNRIAALQKAAAELRQLQMQFMQSVHALPPLDLLHHRHRSSAVDDVLLQQQHQQRGGLHVEAHAFQQLEAMKSLKYDHDDDRSILDVCLDKEAIVEEQQQGGVRECELVAMKSLKDAHDHRILDVSLEEGAMDEEQQQPQKQGGGEDKVKSKVVATTISRPEPKSMMKEPQQIAGVKKNKHGAPKGPKPYSSFNLCYPFETAYQKQVEHGKDLVSHFLDGVHPNRYDPVEHPHPEKYKGEHRYHRVVCCCIFSRHSSSCLHGTALKQK